MRYIAVAPARAQMSQCSPPQRRILPLNECRGPVSKRSFSRWLTFPAAIAFLLFYVVFVNNIKGKITEPDIWWHLRNAQHLVDTHDVVRFDTYSYTAAGAPWVAHEWLSELAYYGAFRAFGLRGMFFVFVVLSAAIFMALYYRCRQAGANPKTASILLMLGILIGSVSFGPRPLLFGWVCLLALLIILDHYRSTRSSALWVLPLLFCLWINLHGSWLIGMFMFGLFIVSGLVEGEWGVLYAERFTPAEIGKLLAVAAASVAALFVNPFGYRLVAYPFDLLFRQQANIANVDEWQSVDFHTERGKLMMVLLLALFAAALLSRKRWKLYEVLATVLALYVSLMYWRMQFFGALVLVPMLSARVPLFPPYDPEKEKPLLNGAIMAGVVVLLLLRMPSEARLNQQVETQYPARALEAMRAQGIVNGVFNDYNWGGYMIWNARDIKTFIDGRADLFVYRGVFDDYLKIMRLQGWEDLLNRYGVRAVLLQPDAFLSQVLNRDPCWKRVYDDNLAAVYRRELGAPGCALASAAGK